MGPGGKEGERDRIEPRTRSGVDTPRWNSKDLAEVQDASRMVGSALGLERETQFQLDTL